MKKEVISAGCFILLRIKKRVYINMFKDVFVLGYKTLHSIKIYTILKFLPYRLWGKFVFMFDNNLLFSLTLHKFTNYLSDFH